MTPTDRREMGEIQRWTVCGDGGQAAQYESDKGEWVKYEDHVADLAAARERAERAEKAIALPGNGDARHSYAEKPDEEKVPRDLYTTIWRLYDLAQLGASINYAKVEEIRDEAQAIIGRWNDELAQGSINWSCDHARDIVTLCNSWETLALECRSLEYSGTTIEHLREELAEAKNPPTGGATGGGEG